MCGYSCNKDNNSLHSVNCNTVLQCTLHMHVAKSISAFIYGLTGNAIIFGLMQTCMLHVKYYRVVTLRTMYVRTYAQKCCDPECKGRCQPFTRFLVKNLEVDNQLMIFVFEDILLDIQTVTWYQRRLNTNKLSCDRKFNASIN